MSAGQGSQYFTPSEAQDLNSLLTAANQAMQSHVAQLPQQHAQASQSHAAHRAPNANVRFFSNQEANDLRNMLKFFDDSTLNGDTDMSAEAEAEPNFDPPLNEFGATVRAIVGNLGGNVTQQNQNSASDPMAVESNQQSFFLGRRSGKGSVPPAVPQLQQVAPMQENVIQVNTNNTNFFSSEETEELANIMRSLGHVSNQSESENGMFSVKMNMDSNQMMSAFQKQPGPSGQTICSNDNDSEAEGGAGMSASGFAQVQAQGGNKQVAGAGTLLGLGAAAAPRLNAQCPGATGTTNNALLWQSTNWSALSGTPMSGAAGPTLPPGQQLLMPPPPLDANGNPLAVVLHGPVAVAYPHIPSPDAGPPWYSIHTLPPFGTPGGPPPNSLCLPPTMHGYCLPTTQSANANPISACAQPLNRIQANNSQCLSQLPPSTTQVQSMAVAGHTSHAATFTAADLTNGIGSTENGGSRGDSGGHGLSVMLPFPRTGANLGMLKVPQNSGVPAGISVVNEQALKQCGQRLLGMLMQSAACAGMSEMNPSNTVDEFNDLDQLSDGDAEGDGDSDNEPVVTRKPSKSRSWTKDEDQLVRDLVKEHGLRRWAFIASCLQGKTQKQVYARWRDYLQPGISSKPWTKQEQRLLVSLHAKVGNQWAVLAKMMPGRSPNAIKNRFHATRRKMERSQKKLGGVPEEDEDGIGDPAAIMVVEAAGTSAK